MLKLLRVFVLLLPLKRLPVSSLLACLRSPRSRFKDDSPIPAFTDLMCYKNAVPCSVQMCSCSVCVFVHRGQEAYVGEDGVCDGTHI